MQIREWAEAFHRRAGNWPTRDSGEIADAPGETWKGIEAALYAGRRGPPGGMTLHKLALIWKKPR